MSSKVQKEINDGLAVMAYVIGETAINTAETLQALSSRHKSPPSILSKEKSAKLALRLGDTQASLDIMFDLSVDELKGIKRMTNLFQYALQSVSRSDYVAALHAVREGVAEASSVAVQVDIRRGTLSDGLLKVVKSKDVRRSSSRLF